jgi:hypothetical protein
VENVDKRPSEIAGEPASPIILFDRFLESLGVTSSTGWRWRKSNWLKTLNISGRVYIARSEIDRFQQRVLAGEFAKPHKVPNPKRKAVGQ